MISKSFLTRTISKSLLLKNFETISKSEERFRNLKNDFEIVLQKNDFEIVIIKNDFKIDFEIWRTISKSFFRKMISKSEEGF